VTKAHSEKIGMVEPNKLEREKATKYVQHLAQQLQASGEFANVNQAGELSVNRRVGRPERPGAGLISAAQELSVCAKNRTARSRCQ